MLLLQAAVSTNHLLNAVNIVSTCKDLVPDSVLQSTIVDSAAGNGSEMVAHEQLRRCDALVGQAYYDSKAELLQAEQHLLRALKFELQQCQPYSTLLHVCHILRLPLPLIQASICILNDVAAFSGLLLDTPALLLGAASVHLASLLLRCTWVLPDAEATGAHWCEALGVSLTELERVGHAMMDALAHARQQQPQAGAA